MEHARIAANLGNPSMTTRHAGLAMRVAHLLIAMLLLATIACSLASAQSFTRSMLLARIESSVDRPLPSIAEVLGDPLVAPAAPLIAIGFLSNAESDGHADWGGAVGWYLMESASNVDAAITAMPGRFFLSDARGESDAGSEDRAAQLGRVASRTGARMGLSGSVSVNEGRFDITLRLLAYPEESELASRHEEGAIDQLGAVVQRLGDELLAQAAATASTTTVLEHGALALPASGELQTLAETFGRLRGASIAEQLAAYDAVRQAHRDYASFTTLYLAALDASSNAVTMRAKLPGVLADRNDSVGSQAYVYSLESRYALRGIDPDAVAKLTDLVRAHPNNLAAWFALSNAYIDEEVLFSPENKCRCSPPIDHHAGYAKAVVIAREIARRWPDNYRSWWTLSYNISRYASLVRGAGWWRDVPESNRQRYGDLMTLGDDCLFQAIRLHPNQSGLFVNKIAFDVHAGRDPMDSFRIAAGLAPHMQDPYRQAFNYVSPKWGGSMEDLREVYSLAKRNNPDVDWPRALRDENAPEAKPLVDFDNPWIARGLGAVAVLLVLLAAAALWARRRG